MKSEPHYKMLLDKVYDLITEASPELDQLVHQARRGTHTMECTDGILMGVALVRLGSAIMEHEVATQVQASNPSVGDQLDHYKELCEVAQHSNKLTDKDKEFARDYLAKLNQYGRKTYLSTRQASWLDSIEDRLNGDLEA